MEDLLDLSSTIELTGFPMGLHLTERLRMRHSVVKEQCPLFNQYWKWICCQVNSPEVANCKAGSREEVDSGDSALVSRRHK